MAQLLPRYTDEPAVVCPLEMALLAMEAREARARADVAAGAGGAAGGDWQRLRGLPAIGRGVSGAVPGTRPEIALLAKEHHRR